ncbi:hypothetical protein [Nocardia testacea]|nr:hypothetical protein [Nocardia testacea]
MPPALIMPPRGHSLCSELSPITYETHMAVACEAGAALLRDEAA